MGSTGTPQRPEIEFDEIRHQYTVGGEVYQSVTQVLKAVLRVESPYWQMKYRQRGSMVHRIMEAINENDWDPEAMVLPPGWGDSELQELVGRGAAYQRFVDENGFQPLVSEYRVADAGLRLAGTIDTMGRATRGKFRGCILLVDVKSGIPTPAARLQLALYHRLLFDPPDDFPEEILVNSIAAHVVLQVRKNGTPRPEYRTGNQILEDGIIADSVLNVYAYMAGNGLL